MISSASGADCQIRPELLHVRYATKPSFDMASDLRSLKDSIFLLDGQCCHIFAHRSVVGARFSQCLTHIARTGGGIQ